MPRPRESHVTQLGERPSWLCRHGMDKIAGHRANLKKKIYSQTQDSGENNTEFSALLTISCENCHNRGIHNERQRARLINTENLDCWSLWQ